MRRLLVIALLLLSGCTKEPPALPPAFLGTWQSDEELTLESMRQSDAISDEALAVFENNFFGRLVVIISETDRASFFIDEGGLPDIVAHNIAAADASSVTFIEPSNEELGLSTERTWYVDGDLIAIPIEEWGFTEYFRRVSPAPTEEQEGP